MDSGRIGTCEACGFAIYRVGEGRTEGGSTHPEDRLPCPHPEDCPGQLPLL